MDPLEQHPCVPLLRRAARAGAQNAPEQLHPATRSFLLAEAARAYPPSHQPVAPHARGFWFRLAVAGPAFALLVAGAFFWAGLRQDTQPVALTPTGQAADEREAPADRAPLPAPAMEAPTPAAALAKTQNDLEPTPELRRKESPPAERQTALAAAPSSPAADDKDLPVVQAAPNRARAFSAEREKSSVGSLLSEEPAPRRFRRVLVAAPTGTKAPGFLERFSLVVEGSKLRITDTDGSVFEGAIPEAGAAFSLTGTSKALGRAISMEGTLDPKQEGGAMAGLAAKEAPAAVLELRVDLGGPDPVLFKAVEEY